MKLFLVRVFITCLLLVSTVRASGKSKLLSVTRATLNLLRSQEGFGGIRRALHQGSDKDISDDVDQLQEANIKKLEEKEQELIGSLDNENEKLAKPGENSTEASGKLKQLVETRATLNLLRSEEGFVVVGKALDLISQTYTSDDVSELREANIKKFEKYEQDLIRSLDDENKNMAKPRRK